MRPLSKLINSASAHGYMLYLCKLYMYIVFPSLDIKNIKETPLLFGLKRA